ncbi:MAG: hypothetical protein AAGF83_17550 [Cyanobacteria bacterium P01_G01_bin.67]
MNTNNTSRTIHFCIFDYYLDGTYLKWEEVEGECPILTIGQQWTVNLSDGTQVTGEIIETVMVSETERKILLRSC